MESNWRQLADRGLLNMVVPFPIGGLFTKAARFVAAPNTYLTDCVTSTNGRLTISVTTDPDLPLITGYGIYLFDAVTYPHFPHGANVEPD